MNPLEVDKLPEEKENPNEPFNPLICSKHSLYYYCPKCSNNVRGIFGAKDSNGKSWCVSICDQCGYSYKVEIK